MRLDTFWVVLSIVWLAALAIAIALVIASM
jgi:hypothetical protein